MRQRDNGVFISYTRADAAFAKKVSELLKEYSIPVFADTEFLSFGMDFAATVVNEIRICRLVVAIISKHSLTSQWLLKEIDTAFQAGKRIIPILVSDISPVDLPFAIRDTQCLYLEDIIRNPKHLTIAIQEREFGSENSPNTNVDKTNSENQTIPSPQHYSRRGFNKTGCLIISALAFIVLIILFLVVPVYQETPTSRAPENDSTSQINPSFRGQKDDLQDNDLTQYYSDDSQREIITIALLILLISSFMWITLLYRKYKKEKVSFTLISDVKVCAEIDETSSIVKGGQEQNFSLNKNPHRISLDYSKYNRWKKINCFIAGSIALQAERDALRSSISIACNRWSKKNFQILSYTYEDFDRKFTRDGQQSLYDYFITHDADYAIFVIKGDVGDLTIREFDKAYAAFKTHGKPAIVVYNNQIDKATVSAEDLRKRVSSIHQYWIDYKDIEAMRLHFLDLISTELFTLFEADLVQS